MALRAVPDHPKFSHFKTILGAGRAEALGYLECIWHFTGRFTPRGNIGKYDDLAIESWCEWRGQSGALIHALIDSHWLDEDTEYRILVHDWEHHADKATKQAVARAKVTFCSPTGKTAREHVDEIRGSVDTPGEHVDTPGEQNSDLSALPVPVPEPVPDPEPGAAPRAVAQVAEIPKRTLSRSGSPIPPDATQRIRKIADAAPLQQDYEFGIEEAIHEMSLSGNPPATLAAIEENVPLWWDAMRSKQSGVRLKMFRYVIKDGDYLRKPPPKEEHSSGGSRSVDQRMNVARERNRG